MNESNMEIRNGISIDKRKVRKMVIKILFDENINQRTKDKTDSDMISKHMETIKEEIHAYQED